MSKKYALAAFLLSISLLPTSWANSLNMPAGVTAISRDVFELHMAIFYICAAIAAIVFVLMFYALIKFRKSQGKEAAHFHSSIKLEIFWTLIPLLILIAMAIPATKTLVTMHDSSKSELTIKITGSQWKWHYEYLHEDIAFLSQLITPEAQIRNQQTKDANYLVSVDNPLVLPSDKKIRFLFTSDDVIHSWWLPDFAVKKDAIPGFINEAWTLVEQTGTYFGQCTELCGAYHAYMPIVVEVKTPTQFQHWLDDKKQQKAQASIDAKKALQDTLNYEQLMQLGEEVYLKACAACHQADGSGMAGIFPAITDSPIALGDINGHIDIVVNGLANSAMPAFAKQLSASEIAAVVTYERNALGNSVGDQAQAIDVQNFMEEQQ